MFAGVKYCPSGFLLRPSSILQSWPSGLTAGWNERVEVEVSIFSGDVTFAKSHLCYRKLLGPVLLGYFSGITLIAVALTQLALLRYGPSV